jgi:hypothetical protein
MSDQSIGIMVVFGAALVLMGLRAAILKYPGGFVLSLLARFGMVSQKARGLAGKAGPIKWVRTTASKRTSVASSDESSIRRSPNHQRPHITHGHYYN